MRKETVMTELLEQIKELVRQAGALLLEAAPEELEISSKEGHGNFVTDYDVRVQELLFSRLKELLPGAAFVGEEGDGPISVGKGYTFIIDPIDGTTNFICGYRFSAISVGLALNGEAVLGVVYNPWSEELYWAQRGEGAYLNGKRLQLRNRPLSEGVVCCGTAPYNLELTDQTFDVMKTLFLHSMDIRRQGSAALDLCYLAAGRNVLFFEWKLSPWDFAAASVIIREAGGVLTAMDGGEASLCRKGSVLAGTPRAVEEFHALTGI